MNLKRKLKDNMESEEKKEDNSLDKVLDKIEHKVMMFFIFTLFSPIIAYHWIKDRHYYRNKLSKLKVGDFFVVNEDTDNLKKGKLYEVIGIDGNILEFRNEKNWWDKIHRDNVKKAIFI